LRLRFFILRRAITSVLALFVITFIAFLLVYAGLMKEPQQIKIEFGANTSILSIYLRYISDLFTGNLGLVPEAFPEFKAFPLSFVITLLLPDSVQLIFVTMIFSIPLAILESTIAIRRSNSTLDVALRVFAFFFYSTPIIVTSFVIQMMFARGGLFHTGLPDTGAFTIGLKPLNFVHYGVTYPTHVPIVDGIVNGNFAFALSSFEHLVMPSAVLILWTSSALSRYLTSTMFEHRNAPSVQFARSLGYPEARIVKLHIRRVSYGPTLSAIGFVFGGLIGWIVVTEVIFGYPGIGTLLIDSTEYFFFNGLATCFFILGIMVLVLNFISDVVNIILDPRIKY